MGRGSVMPACLLTGADGGDCYEAHAYGFHQRQAQNV